MQALTNAQMVTIRLIITPSVNYVLLVTSVSQESKHHNVAHLAEADLLKVPGIDLKTVPSVQLEIFVLCME
jgi:hypothetical protein